MESNSNTYLELVELRDKLRIRYENHHRQMEEAQSDLIAVERSLELLETKGTRRDDEYPILPPSTLVGLSQIEAVKKIARANGGIFYVRDVKKLLLAAGLIENPNNAANIIYTLTERNDCFERVKRGVYRLVEANDGPKVPLLIASTR